jgi:hypothetical protein
MVNDRVLLCEIHTNTTLKGEKGIQSIIEVDSRCTKSNLLTDRVSLLYTGVTREVILITVVETVEKAKKKDLL